MRLGPILASLALLALVVMDARAQMPTVKLTAEDGHTIKEIVLKEMNAPKVAAGDYKIGDRAPAEAELQSFPPLVASKVSAVRAHRFFVSGQKVVIVDPKDNTIADIIE